ncbi:MAG: MFS transporter, partial [Pseudomonadota bacterium]
MTETAIDAVAKEKTRFVRALAALKDRRMLAMLLLSFAAGLPYGAVLGTLNAWLTEGGVDVRAIGAFSIITLAYSFKFLWAPVFQKAQYPLPSRLGPRRAWLLSFQIPITVMLIVLALGDPVANIGFAALLALLTAIFSASHDIVLDAWRIEVARSEEDKDLMSALYQFGYRLSGLITGFIALLMAERIGWMGAYLIISGVMAVSMIGTLIAPEPKSDVSNADRPSYTTLLNSQQTRISAGLVSIAWFIAFLLIAWFVSQALTTDPPPSGRGFVLTQGPIIVGLCIIFPAALAASLIPDFGKSPSVAHEHIGEGRVTRVLNGLFRGILDPLMDLIARLRWGALIVLSLALMYRFTDAVWGGYAYPFYLGEDHGALGHSLDDVAVASKFFGVIMTVSGAALGVFAVSVFGRMTCLIAGAVVAAATNLLFADLAASASFTDGILNITQLDLLLGSMAEWSYSLLGTAAENRTGADRMARLMLVIAAENLAGGFASVAIVIYLTSVVNPRFAAVQYALLASLSLLVGTLGRPLLGDIINEQGFYTVFIITFWLGMIA